MSFSQYSDTCQGGREGLSHPSKQSYPDSPERKLGHFTRALIHSFHKYMLSPTYVPGASQSTGPVLHLCALLSPFFFPSPHPGGLVLHHCPLPVLIGVSFLPFTLSSFLMRSLSPSVPYSCPRFVLLFLYPYFPCLILFVSHPCPFLVLQSTPPACSHPYPPSLSLVSPSALSLSPTCLSPNSLCLQVCLLPLFCGSLVCPSYPVGCLLLPLQQFLLQGLTEATRGPEPLHNGLALPELLLRHQVSHALQVRGQGLLQGGHGQFGQPLEKRVHKALCLSYVRPMPVPRLVPSICVVLPLCCSLPWGLSISRAQLSKIMNLGSFGLASLTSPCSVPRKG